MRDLLIAIAAAAAAPAAHADAAYPKGCFSPPICVSVQRTKSSPDFNYESLTDQPYSVAVSSSQHGLGGINHSIHFKTCDLPRTQKLFSYELPRAVTGTASGTSPSTPVTQPNARVRGSASLNARLLAA